MRFMILVKASHDSEAGKLPNPTLLEAMGKFNEELVRAGVMLAGEGLQSSAKGARMKFSKDRKPEIVDGPFTETKELVAGFWIWKAASKQECIDWLSRAPFTDEEIEIRQIFEAEDFAPVDPTGTLREREEMLRKQVEARS